jgi:hypothetical protein
MDYEFKIRLQCLELALNAVAPQEDGGKCPACVVNRADVFEEYVYTGAVDWSEVDEPENATP